MPRTTKKLTREEALPNRGRDLVNWFSDTLRKVSEHHSIERLSEVVASGGNRDLLRRTLLGEQSGKEPRPLKLVEAVRIANELNMHIADLLIRFGFDLQRPTAPFLGYVNANGEVVESKTDDKVLSPMSAHDLRALELKIPGPLDRAVIFYRKSTDRAPNDVGRLAVVKPTSLDCALLCTLSERDGGRFDIEPFNRPANKFIDSVDWSSPVLWVKLA